MASEEDHAVYNEEDLDDDDDDESEDLNPNPPRNLVDEDDDVDVDDDDVGDSTSSSNLAAADSLHPPPAPPISSSSAAAREVTIAVAGSVPNDSLHPDSKRQRIDDVTIAVTTTVVEEKKPLAFDESRKLFQRLWTDEDEIELLQGFLDYSTQRGTNNSSHHHDTTAFYDQIKSKLQLDFNKNQLVEKLRRLKKKYRNVMGKIGSGKEYVFKSAHDQATFEISRKIWSGGGTAIRGGAIASSAVADDGGLDDEDANPNPNLNFRDHSPNPNPNGIDVKTPKSRKRSRGGGVKIEEKQGCSGSQPYNQQTGGVNFTHTPAAPPTATASLPVPNLIEETVRSCLSPIFKELLHNAMNLNSSRGGGFGLGLALGPMPFGFGGGGLISGELAADEKWRKQQILELEVYLKRLELVQDQIKAQLGELRSMGSW